MVTSLFFVSWAATTGWLASAEGAWTAKVVDLIYPASDVLILTIVITVVLRSTRSWKDPLTVIAWAFFCLAIADSGYVYLTAHGNGASNTVFDELWVLGFLLLALAALLPTPAPVAPPDPASPDVPMEPVWTFIVEYLPVVLAAGAGAYLAASGVHIDAVEVFTVVAIALLVLARQFMIVAENRSLTGRLRWTIGQLRWLTLHDTLTGLPNRALFHDRLDLALASRARVPRTLVVAFCDVDDFKAVNDTFGHDVGDELLVAVGRALRRSVRAADTVARDGGDEFAVIFEIPGDDAAAAAVLQRMVDAVSVPLELSGHLVPCGVSIGFASDTGTGGAEDLLRRADVAMYRAKALGKCQLVRYRPDMHDGVALETATRPTPGRAGSGALAGRSPAVRG